MRKRASVPTNEWLRPRYSAPSGVGETKLTFQCGDLSDGKEKRTASGTAATAPGETAIRNTWSCLSGVTVRLMRCDALSTNSRTAPGSPSTLSVASSSRRTSSGLIARWANRVRFTRSRSASRVHCVCRASTSAGMPPRSSANWLAVSAGRARRNRAFSTACVTVSLSSGTGTWVPRAR